tara:strand:- start:44 stop:574 length:531 start_codon:yes stop_codon:yes gene_type:complete
MPSIQAIADSLSTVFTDERYPLGTTYVQTDAEVKNGTSGVDTTKDFPLLKGERVWIFIKATGAIGKGDLVARTAGAEPFGGAPDAADDTMPAALLGVADHAIDSGSFSWVIARGCCVVSTQAATAGQYLESHGSTGTAGEVHNAANAAASGVIGMALEALSGSVATGFTQSYIDVL